jgi:hypothetical protein
MNIFWLDKNPKINAQMHLDKHVVKMIIEYAQLLSTAHRLLDGTELSVLTAAGRKKKVWQLPDHRDSVLYSATHANHPSAVWVRQDYHNYTRLYQLFVATCDEYTYRYGRTHLTDTKLREALATPPNYKIDHITKLLTDPTPAMPDECKIPGDVVASYQKYYIDKKADMAKWTNREPPEWFIKGVKEKDAYIQLQVQEVRSLFRKDSKHVSTGRASRSTVSRV